MKKERRNPLFFVFNLIEHRFQFAKIDVFHLLKLHYRNRVAAFAENFQHSAVKYNGFIRVAYAVFDRGIFRRFYFSEIIPFYVFSAVHFGQKVRYFVGGKKGFGFRFLVVNGNFKRVAVRKQFFDASWSV